MNETLIADLKVLLADTVALKYKAQGYHWNVEGPDMGAWHVGLFTDIYEDMEDALDTFAEWIRKLDTDRYAPFKLSRFVELTTVPETTVSSNPLDMARDLDESIYMVMDKIVAVFDVATAAKQQGLANFLADRQDMHQRWCWMLKASLKAV
jgi:DNA-binding ferritin-like protein